MCRVSCDAISPWSAKSLLLACIILGGEDAQTTVLDNWVSISLLFHENTYLTLPAFKTQLSIFPSTY